MKIDIHTNATVFGRLKSEWNTLLQASASNTIFGTWEWQSIWWQVYEPGDLWVITVRDEADRLVGIAPWFVDQKKVIRAIGCKEVTDYVDLIVLKGQEQPVYQAIAQALFERRAQFDHLNLCNVPANSPTLSIFVEMLASCGFATEKEQINVCPVIELPLSWDDYLGGLTKKRRHEIRRKLRRADNSGEDIAMYSVDDSHDLNAEMDAFMELMAASSPEKAAFLQDTHHARFFIQVMQPLYNQGWLSLNFLTINGERSAAYLNFVYNNRILVYNSGLKYEPYGHLSPGIVLLTSNIQSAITAGHTIYDFLRGDEVYKYRMGGEDTAIYSLTIIHNQEVMSQCR